MSKTSKVALATRLGTTRIKLVSRKPLLDLRLTNPVEGILGQANPRPIAQLVPTPPQTESVGSILWFEFIRGS